MLGPYQVVGILGEGGMGAVYRAKDTRLGRFVAIKVLTNINFSDQERLQRFEQEARATGMLNHPNLLTIYDVGTDGSGAPFLVSELLEGETLRSRLERGALSPRKAVDAALQMAQGLAAAHDKGIVHRDLKPDNIFLTRDGRLKILDFGIAKLTAPAGSDSPGTFQMAATEPGMVMGTVGYMSPEQVRGEPVDHRSDIFSLGTIFHEMLTGQRAFRKNSSIETLSAILKEEPPDLTELLPSLPPAIERLVRRCLEKDREQRFQSARDLAFNLETLSTMSSASTLSSAPPRSTSTSAAATPTMRTAASPAPGTARTSATGITAAPRPQTVARPAMKPKRGVSPVLLVLLYLVSVAGAAYGAWKWAHRKPEEVIEPQFRRMTFRRGEVRSARFTPDGETIVYSAAWDGQPSQIFVVSRSATEARSLEIPESEVVSVSKSAELAVILRRDRFTNLGVLARVPLGGGMPRELAENVVSADWSPDGSNLAIVRTESGKTRIEYPIGTVQYESALNVRDVRVSPDGKRLAILEPFRGENNLTLVENRQATTIARGWARGATGLAWSPDGQEIWVSGTSTVKPPALHAVRVADGTTRLVSRLTGSIRMFDISNRGELLLSNGTWRAALVWKPGGGGQALRPVQTETTGQAGVPVLHQEEPERDASWLDWSIVADLAPDGRTILFSETREGGGAKNAVYLRRLDEPAPLRLGEGIADGLSPDGKWVLAHQGSKLFLLPTGTGQPRELKLNGAFEGGAAWMPDSRRAVVAGAVGGEGLRLHIIDTLDETTKAISPENIWSGGAREFAVSPDGRFVAGMSADETIVIYAADGSSATPVTNAEKGEVPVQWSADGASLLVYRPTALPARVVRITLATGAREPWKEFMPADPAGVYKISPVLVTPDGRGYAYTAMRTLSDLYAVEGLK